MKSKTLKHLEKQLNTDLKNEALDCIKIYESLLSLTNQVSSNTWNMLVNVRFKGYPSDERTFKPSVIGEVFLKGLNN